MIFFCAGDGSLVGIRKQFFFPLANWRDFSYCYPPDE